MTMLISGPRVRIDVLLLTSFGGFLQIHMAVQPSLFVLLPKCTTWSNDELCQRGYTRVDTLSMKSPCTHRGCRDLVFASVEDVTEKLPTFLLVDILGCGFDWNAVADQLSTHFQYCS